MEYKVRKIGNVKGLGDVYQAAAPLDKQLEAFADVGIISLAEPDEVAQIRLAGLSDDFSRTNIAPIAIRNKRTILVRGALNPLRNPLMAAAAVAAQNEGNYLEVVPVIYEKAEAIAKAQEGRAPEDMDAIFVSQDGDFDLTPQHPEAQFMLRRQTVPYFEQKVPKGKIPFYGISTNSKGVAVVNYTWFNEPQDGSGLYCRIRYLDYDNHAFGVLRSGEASARNLGYRLTEIGKANSEIIPVVLNDAGLSGIAGAITRPLSKGLIERLRAGK